MAILPSSWSSEVLIFSGARGWNKYVEHMAADVHIAFNPDVGSLCQRCIPTPPFRDG